MKSETTGVATSLAEVLNVSPHGFWLLIGDREYFLAFTDFPWFRRATLEQLFAIEVYHGTHLHWHLLDVDLDLERILHPEKFPLVSRLDPAS
jgi:hypothetical protein